MRSDTFERPWVLRSLLVSVTLGCWTCSAATPEQSPRAPSVGEAIAEDRPVSQGCLSFIERFRPLYERMTTGMVFRAHDTKLPLVFPSTDSNRVDEIARALVAPSPAEAEADLASRMLETGLAYVATMRGLLDAVSAQDATSYREASTRYFQIHEDLKGINRDCKTKCGRFLVEARLAPEIIQATIRQAYPVFRKCYEAGLGRNQTLTGMVLVKFVIDVTGGVRDVEAVTDHQQQPRRPDPGTERFFETLGFRSTAGTIESTPLQDKQVLECIVRHFRTLRFPRPTTGIVTVVYPIQLMPK